MLVGLRFGASGVCVGCFAGDGCGLFLGVFAFELLLGVAALIAYLLGLGCLLLVGVLADALFWVCCGLFLGV